MFPTYELKEKKRTRICVEFAQQCERCVCLFVVDWIWFLCWSYKNQVVQSEGEWNWQEPIFYVSPGKFSTLKFCYFLLASQRHRQSFVASRFYLYLYHTRSFMVIAKKVFMSFVFYLLSPFACFFCLHSSDFDKCWRHLKAEWSVFHFFWFARTSNKLSGIFLRRRFNWCDLKTSKKMVSFFSCCFFVTPFGLRLASNFTEWMISLREHQV